MTIPIERSRALINARNFLRSLLDPKMTPKVPKAIREDAYWLLRHYPAEYEIEQLAKKLPRLFENEVP